ncbi:MAG: hypothetical protein AAB545_01920 [Patescibacteria group bacterium]
MKQRRTTLEANFGGLVLRTIVEVFAMNDFSEAKRVEKSSPRKIFHGVVLKPASQRPQNKKAPKSLWAKYYQKALWCQTPVRLTT